MAKTNLKSSYHHGNLHQVLLDTATDIIRTEGIENLSLRKLADKSGVSRTAPYHHFKNKNALLCAIAEEIFRLRLDHLESNFNDESRPLYERLRWFMHDYLKFAGDEPEIYELIFGPLIWKQKLSTEELQSSSYECFQFQVHIIKTAQEAGLLKLDENVLRATEVIWATLHGIAKLQIDGIYIHASQVEEMCDCAINIFFNKP